MELSKAWRRGETWRGIRERMRDEGEALAEVEFENSH